MHVSALALTDFRSYKEVTVELQPGTSVFIGANGQGKTNLIEAVAYLATLSSHRVATDTPLVHRDCNRAVIGARVVHGDRTCTVELEINIGTANKARINQTPVSRVRDILGIVRVVMFAPEDIDLIRGDPAGRRRFLDTLAVQLSPRLAGVLSDYDRVLRQRSTLLKSAGTLRGSARTAALSTLEVWDEKLAEAGAEIVLTRAQIVKVLAAEMSRLYQQISGTNDEVKISYESTVTGSIDSETRSLQAQILTQLAEVQSKELDRGVCLIGPHRDDLIIELNEFPAKGYASHGESWSLALSLKLASAYALSESDDRPIVILDDVFAELDTGRRSRLAELVLMFPQVLITGANAADVPIELGGDRFEVAEGHVVPK
jgi:DNA replication and repair protein RecF